MIKLFFDIETLPAAPENKDFVVGILKKKAEKKYGAPKSSDESLYLGTSFNGNYGRICCIGYVKEDGTVSKGVLKGTEQEILTQFWELARDVELFIGHNVFGFDFPFIYKRSIILGVKPRTDINFAKYRSQPIFDTMQEWEKWNSYGATSLDTLAKILDLPTSKDEMDGSQVWTYYQQGRLEDICRYCLKDVELTRKVYYRIVFEEPLPDQVEHVLEQVETSLEESSSQETLPF